MPPYLLGCASQACQAYATSVATVAAMTFAFPFSMREVRR